MVVGGIGKMVIVRRTRKMIMMGIIFQRPIVAAAPDVRERVVAVVVVGAVGMIETLMIGGPEPFVTASGVKSTVEDGCVEGVGVVPEGFFEVVA